MAQDFSQRLPYLMRTVSNAMSQQLERTLRRLSLTHAQLAALAQLGLEHPGALSGAEMGHRAGVTAQAMSSALADLEARGLVERRPNPGHSRVVDVTITDDGIALLDRAQTAARDVEARALAALTPAQQRQLRAILRRLMVSMDLYLPDITP
ncbi:MarR family winged helix-turn-helix transcriptional regulator [Streptomyces sp. NPDC048441]|uniref:MarR family winged helix-turn-helix transcriptional regulator n=1 Tax=Streptomyces sp. NPDC048441 TaxID=3365552 RepID=UPI0037199E15